MRVDLLVPAALAGLTLLLVALASVDIGVKAVRGRRDARRARLEARLRPQLLRLVASERLDLADMRVEGRAAARVLDSLAVGLLPKLRGSDRASVVALLDRRGAVDDALARALRRRANTRARAAEQLGTLGLERALPALVRMLRDRNRDVRTTAARAIGRIGSARAVTDLLRAVNEERIPIDVASLAITRIGTPAVPALLDGIDTTRPPARALTCELLGLLGALSAVPTLSAIALGDDNPRCRFAAIRALGRIGAPSCIDPLLSAMRAPEAALRAEAARSLGRVGSPDALDVLAGAVGDEHTVANAASAALAQLGAAGARSLQQLATMPGRGGAHAREALDVAGLAA